MPAPRVRGDYDVLSRIATIFQQQAGETKRTLGRITRVTNTLQGGHWIGKGATAFYREMEGEVIPSLERLQAAQEAGNQTTRQIIKILQQAEDDAARILGAIAAAALMGAAGAGAALGEALGGVAGRTARDLLAMDPDQLFSHDYMRDLIGSQFTGAGRDLGNLMDDLLTAPDDASADQILVIIARLRDRPVEELREEYGRFKDLAAERDAAQADPVPGLSGAHPSFNGSNTQMRYGSVVGDAFGIDPVFGAMLNPTGGLVGPGNWAIAGDDTAVGYHGVVHDAAGYLQTYHGVGPGYDYLGVDPIPTTNPLSGQVAGIAYWKASTELIEPARAVGGEFVGVFNDAVDIGSWVFDQAASVF